MEKKIEIPEGYEARIEGNKVILEPKESEDERIRKELVEYFKHYSGGDNISVKFPTWIAYLEKQKEQKPAEWSEEDDNIYNNALDAIYYKDLNDKDEVVDALKALCDLIYKKRKVIPPYARWKPSEDQIQSLYNILQDPKKAGSISDRASIVGLIHDLKKLL